MEETFLDEPRLVCCYCVPDLFVLFLFRIGFVFVVDTDEKADGSADAGVAFLRSLNYIAEEYDATQAFMSMVSVSLFFNLYHSREERRRLISMNLNYVSMLLQMYNEVDIGGSLSVETVTAYLKKTFPKADAAEILGADSSYDDGRKVGRVSRCFAAVK